MDNTNNLPATNIAPQNLSPIAVLKNLNAFTKIKEFDKIGHLVIPICNKHAVLSGIDKEIDPFTKEEIAKYTAIHLKNLTIEEIEIAFQNERFNLYDSKTIHYNFFSIDYYTEIIIKYKKWKQTQMVKHNIDPNNISLLPEKSVTASELEIKQTRIEFIKLVFNEININNKKCVDESFTLYELFVDSNLIVISDKQKKDLYKVMLNNVNREKNKELSSTFNTNKRRAIISFINDLNKNKNKNYLVINKCKTYLIAKVIANHKDVNTLLKKIKW